MSHLIEWINLNSGVLSLLFSFVVAAATVAYVVLTRQLVRETRAVREAQLQPHVGIRAEPNPRAFGFIDLIVENLGPGAAYEIAFTFTPDLQLEVNPARRLSDIGFLRHGFRYLPPGQPVSTFLTRPIGNEKLEGPDRIKFNIEVRYQDTLAHQHSEPFDIDFAQFVGMMRIGGPPLPDIADHLKKIADSVQHIESGWSKLKVIQYTPDDMERERDNVRLAQLSRQLIDDVSKEPQAPPASGDAG